jgi:hypothetical protein
MPDFKDDLKGAHDQGRADTREILRSGKMSDEYSRKLTKGSFGLTLWVLIGGACWLVLGAHWSLWLVVALFLPAWFLAGVAWALVQLAAIMLIWHSRGLGPFRNSN